MRSITSTKRSLYGEREVNGVVGVGSDVDILELTTAELCVVRHSRIECGRIYFLEGSAKDCRRGAGD